MALVQSDIIGDTSSSVFSRQKAEYCEVRRLSESSGFPHPLAPEAYILKIPLKEENDFRNMANLIGISTLTCKIVDPVNTQANTSEIGDFKIHGSIKLSVQFEKLSALGYPGSVQHDFELPNLTSIKLSRKLLVFLDKLNIYPDRITESAEGGISLVFYSGNYRMYFEIYNDGEMGYIAENAKVGKTLDNMEVKSIPSAQRQIKRFLDSSR